MAVTLHNDVWFLICEVLFSILDFNSLFNLAVSSKQLAVSAIPFLYRSQQFAPVVGGGIDETGAKRSRLVQKWALLWRTILLSSSGKTLFQYCQHLRVLNLRDLNNLLDDSLFQQRNLFNNFFTDGLESFKVLQKNAPKKHSTKPMDRVAIINEVGEAVTKHTPLLEGLSGEISPSSLQEWVPRLPRLQSLELWRGNTLEDGVENLLRQFCPFFDSLSIYEWRSDDTDSRMATFITGLQPQTLKSFEVISTAFLGSQTFLALNVFHHQALTNLKLLHRDLTDIGKLKDCVALRSFHLDGGGEPRVWEQQAIDGISDLLRRCKNLQAVSLMRVGQVPSVITPVLQAQGIELRSLLLSGYDMTTSGNLHSALSNQKGLESLVLSANSDDATRVHVEILVESVKELKALRSLQLKQVSDSFVDEDIIILVHGLDELEEFGTSGYGLSDQIWPVLVKPKLRGLTFSALTKFSFHGIMDFISCLDSDGNYGFALSVLNADPDFNLSDGQQKIIRTEISRKLNGSFDYFLNRGVQGQVSPPQNMLMWLSDLYSSDGSDYSGD